MAGVETQHSEYIEYKPFWKIMRDCNEGQHAVHKAAKAYLPKLSGQNDTDYRAYMMRATFHNATRRTIESMLGMMFRKDPSIEGGETFPELLTNIDLNYTTLDAFTKKVAREFVTVGRAVALVDYNASSLDTVTLAQAQAENRRAYVVLYEAESLINWRVEPINGSPTLTLAVLVEKQQVINGFQSKEEIVYRVLSLEEGRYISRIWTKPEGARDYIPTSETIPLRNGAPLPYIPLFVYGIDGQAYDPEEPPLLDLANINLSHYRTTADLEHGAHFTALPTAVISGYQKQDGESFSIGSQSAWVFGDPAAKASYLEFTGSGLGSLEKRLEVKEHQMAIQGARMLAPDKAVAETLGTEVIRRAGEISFLSAISIAISDLMTEIVNECLLWMGYQTDFIMQINRDFMPAKMNPQELTALVQAVQGGQISQQTFFEALQAGNMVRDSLTFEEEEGRRETQAVLLPSLNASIGA